jgi:extradiol dioxygenase family protein
MTLRPFHLAIPVRDLVETREFYRTHLRCLEGRSSERWVDLDFFGHQVVLHLDEGYQGHTSHNPVDGHDVPVPHFGVVLDWDDWQNLARHLTSLGVAFHIAPYVRFKGQVGEQATMFLFDPSGNALEFKAFKDIQQLFAS